MTNLDDQLKKIEESKKSAEKHQAELNASIEAVRAGIQDKTYSTGDVVKDFLIVAYGLKPDANIEKKLRDLQKTIDGSQGQQMLVVSRQKSYEPPTGCFGGEHSNIDGGIDLLGIIEGQLSFDYETLEVLIPVQKYAERNSNKRKWQEHKGKIKINVLDFLKLDEWRQHGFVSDVLNWHDYSCGSRVENYQFRILTGEEVELFFYLQEEPYLWDTIMSVPLLDALRKNPSKGIHEDNFKIFGCVDTSYSTALKLLETEALKEFKKKQAEEIARRKEALAKGILENLAAELTGVRTEVNNGVFVYNLGKAVELGMHKEPKVIVDYKNIPGLRLDLRAYILGACKQHKIPLSE